MQKTVGNLKELIRAGKAITPSDVVIKGGNLINVMTSEIYPADVAVFKDTIIAIGDVEDYIGENTEIIDATGKYIAPGLIDGHIHSECSKLSITSYSKMVVPRGTTSMISGLDEYIAVSGLEGLKEVLAEAEASPLKVFWGAPHQTPYTIPQSTVSYNITKETHEEVQKWSECHGVWETVTEFILEEDENTLGAIEVAAKNNLPVFGCAPMCQGKKLNALLAAGVRLDHESYSHEEVVEKLRNGMHMIIRESNVTPFLKENIRAITEVNAGFSRRVSFCTDDVTASDVLTVGHVDNCIRKAIEAGVEPMAAIQMATINSAEAYRLDHMIGAVVPGKLADILLVDSPETFNVLDVMVEGKMVAKDNKLTYDLQPPARSEVLKGVLKCPKVSASDFEYKVDIENGTATVLSMDVKGPFVRKRRDADLEVINHIVQPDPANDVAMVSVLERFGRNGNKSLGFCTGWKLKKGAMASSAAPDDNNIVVMGVNSADMALAVNHLIDNGGGQVVVADGKVVEFLPLPVGGITSDIEPEEMAAAEKVINASAGDLGCELKEPLMYMFFLPITAIPDYAITDLGVVDCIALEIISPIISLTEK